MKATISPSTPITSRAARTETALFTSSTNVMSPRSVGPAAPAVGLTQTADRGPYGPYSKAGRGEGGRSGTPHRTRAGGAGRDSNMCVARTFELVYG
ncbi:hypothetical protein GCM10010326_49000 [Streptomyces xanthochromogenes]|uniref:Uncharacterized protein n=1 Tax=Streptomyces xanthochromogenes TaxID=67384 RepID=A0ABQ3AF23_9ACTN|nr:hypothetical protein GCM10010326_49000 [Streptomyces xanthochromogenes]